MENDRFPDDDNTFSLQVVCPKNHHIPIYKTPLYRELRKIAWEHVQTNIFMAVVFKPVTVKEICVVHGFFMS
jgi:hypothetical protein